MSNYTSKTQFETKEQSVKYVREVLGVSNSRTRNSRKKFADGQWYIGEMLDILKRRDSEEKPSGLYHIDYSAYGLGLAVSRGVLVTSAAVALNSMSLYKVAGLIGELIFEGVNQNDTHKWLNEKFS